MHFSQWCSPQKRIPLENFQEQIRVSKGMENDTWKLSRYEMENDVHLYHLLSQLCGVVECHEFFWDNS